MADKPKITKRDLSQDYDESKFDRVGKPIDVELHDAGNADDAAVKQAKSHTLVDMAEDYEFFTTAVIHAATNFDRDPVVEYNRLYPDNSPDELPLAIDYTEPFFQGLGVGLVKGQPVNLDRRIYAIVKDKWLELRDTIVGMAMMDRHASFYARLAFYEMEIVDPFALKKLRVVDTLPMVPITVFGVSSNKSFAYLQPLSYPNLPRLVQEKPKPDMIMEGDSVLGPPPSPEHLMRKNDEI